jgi:Protein of unknown function (DUF2842)
MNRRTRKFLGMLIMVVYVPLYMLLIVELSRYALAGASWWLQAIFFLVFGLIWGAPLLPLIKWMERPGANEDVG